ncbi:unnamed protein product [Closterium sp. Yama58-4]|nr:unnamed protein product [Closterium sp. Yama58-4]
MSGAPWHSHDKGRSATARGTNSGGNTALALHGDAPRTGFFLNAGQFLAKPGVSPPDWVRRLAPLHDSAPTDSFPLVGHTVEAELARADVAGSDVASAADVARVRLEDVFAEFEEEPVGSASIAQVGGVGWKGRARLSNEENG